MTQTELNQLTPEQKRIKIAEACGWKITQVSVNEPNDDVTCTPPGKEVDAWRDAGIGLPDYLNSLDAMHEAERGMKRNDYWNYADIILPQVVMDYNNAHRSIDDATSARCATATQRADAFLLTVG